MWYLEPLTRYWWNHDNLNWRGEIHEHVHSTDSITVSLRERPRIEPGALRSVHPILPTTQTHDAHFLALTLCSGATINAFSASIHIFYLIFYERLLKEITEN
jgi:hypothetical protein